MIEPTNPADLQAAAITIGSFLLIGAGANYAQYQHKIETTPEKWQLTRAVPTLLVGALGGFVAWALGLPPEVAAVSGVIGGLVPIVDEVRSSSLTFADVYSIAQKGGDSPAASAAQGAEAAMNEVDSARVREGVRDIKETAEEHGNYYRDPDAILEDADLDGEMTREEYLGLRSPASDESESESGDADAEDDVDNGRRQFLAGRRLHDDDTEADDEVVRDGP